MNGKAILIVLAALALPACDGGDEPRRVEREKKGREETQSIRNAESVGYEADRIADRVDSALDKSEERDARMKEEIEEQSN